MNAFATCLHEARHACLAHAYGFPVHGLVVSDDGASGHCRWTAPADADIAAVMQTTLAGFAGDLPQYRTYSDVHVAARTYAAWCRQHGPQPPFETQLQGWLTGCRMLLLDQSALIYTLADVLQDYGHLEESDLVALLPIRTRTFR